MKNEDSGDTLDNYEQSIRKKPVKMIEESKRASDFENDKSVNDIGYVEASHPSSYYSSPAAHQSMFTTRNPSLGQLTEDALGKQTNLRKYATKARLRIIKWFFY